MVSTTGPQDVLFAARSARERLSGCLSLSVVRGSRAEWADAVGELQGVIDVATAAQDAAMVRLAAIEPEVLDDGEVVELHRALGHVALDGPAIVSGVLNVTAVHAQRRVRAAVRWAADGPEGTDTWTGLGGLHEAMGAGRVDAYRASVVAGELEEVPAEVAASVIAGVDAFFQVEDGPRLRRRVRRMLARISPDLLRQRAVRAVSECRLERWVEEPGVDTWRGTFPPAEAATAWAAIDALAQQYVADGTCTRIGRARAKALTDLVAGNATIDVQVLLTTPAGLPALHDTVPMGAPGDLVEVSGLHPGEPVFVARAALARFSVDGSVSTSTARRGRPAGPRASTETGPGDPTTGAYVDTGAGTPTAACDPSTGARVDEGDALATDAYRPGMRLAALVRARDGRCRFPGCHVGARFCDLDHLTPWPSGATAATNLATLCRRHHRIKQRPGWRAVLHPDATMSWTDPTGRTRTTNPLDQLTAVVLPDTGTDQLPPASNPRLVLPHAPHSALEFALEHHLGPPTPPTRCRADLHRVRSGRSGRAEMVFPPSPSPGRGRPSRGTRAGPNSVRDTEPPPGGRPPF